MDYTKGEWKKYGQHIHINTSNTSDEIATVLWPEWMPESEARANAHLIAAAPDTAESLQELISFLIHDGLDGNPRLIPIINRGTKALKKAGVEILQTAAICAIMYEGGAEWVERKA